jgi:sn-glycerol 3-phosphate transport system substrate-binding protein
LNCKLIKALLVWAALFAAPAVPLSADAATEIQLWHAMEGVPGEVLVQLVERFNAGQKTWQVVPVFKGGYQETLQAGVLAAREGKAPHLLQVYEVGTAGMMASPKLYKPLAQLAAEHRMKLETYGPSVAAFFSDKKGQLQALPFNNSTPVMFYNRDKFRKAGLDPDKPPKTWPQLQVALLALYDAGEACPYTTSWQSWVHLENESAWHNHPFASENNGLGGPRAVLEFNSYLMIKHISLMSSWAKSRLFHYAGRTNQADVRFAAGECAVLTSSSASYSSFKRGASFKVGVAQLPYYDDNYDKAPYNTLIGGAALWTMAGKPAAEYAGVVRFLEFLASPVVSAEWSEKTGYVPVTRGAYLALKNTGHFKEDPDLEIAVNQLIGIKPGNYAKGVRLGNFPRIRDIIDEELELVWNGSKAPKSALDDAVRRGNLVLREFEKSSSF